MFLIRNFKRERYWSNLLFIKLRVWRLLIFIVIINQSRLDQHGKPRSLRRLLPHNIGLLSCSHPERGCRISWQRCAITFLCLKCVTFIHPTLIGSFDYGFLLQLPKCSLAYTVGRLFNSLEVKRSRERPVLGSSLTCGIVGVHCWRVLY